MMRKPPETEVKITETITQQEMIIVSDSRQDETRLLVVEPKPTPVLMEREGRDDWFVLLSGAREKPIVIPRGKKNIKDLLQLP